MIQLLYQGIILGLIISVTIGPAFFAVIQTGISRGFRSGLFLALGIVISDLVLIILCYLGTSVFLESSSDPSNNLYLGIGGGVLLIVFGAVSFTRKPEIFKRRNPKYQTRIKTPRSYEFVIKGFFLNVANPFLIFFWLAAVSHVKAHAVEGQFLNASITFFTGTLAVIFSMDLLKSFIGNRIKKYLTIRLLFWINKIVGVALASFGVALIIKSVWNFLL